MNLHPMLAAIFLLLVVILLGGCTEVTPVESEPVVIQVYEGDD